MHTEQTITRVADLLRAELFGSTEPREDPRVEQAVREDARALAERVLALVPVTLPPPNPLSRALAEVYGEEATDGDATTDRVRLDAPTPPEPPCAVCGEPIRWCLDMFSYTTGHPHELAHARCVWTKPAFREQERQVEDA